MNSASTSFILGYHGCDSKIAERIFAGKDALRESHNEYDWLGDGIYFWEHNSQRAMDFASELSTHPRRTAAKIKTPAVVGAVIDLGFCLNLLDARYISLVTEAYKKLVNVSAELKVELPTNSIGADLLKRDLDCAVIRTLHQIRQDRGDSPFDTVRAAFIEGNPLYDGAGFAAKNHIQICVREPKCIKGYFRPKT